MKQKNLLRISGKVFSISNLYENNHREKAPVLGEVIEGNEQIRAGQIGVFHHNHFYPPSPYFLYDDLYGVPFNKTVFGILQYSGEIMPLCGNILCERIVIESSIPLPPEQQKQYIDRVIVTNPGNTLYKAGQLLFTRPHSYYEIVYNIEGKEYRVHKIHEDNVMGVLK